MDKAAKPPITVISIRCFRYTLYLLNSRISCVICAFFLPPVFLARIFAKWLELPTLNEINDLIETGFVQTSKLWCKFI